MFLQFPPQPHKRSSLLMGLVYPTTLCSVKGHNMLNQEGGLCLKTENVFRSAALDARSFRP
jgi:hypothetical protein